MKISDEILFAYVDGELDAGGRAAVESAMAADPEVARRVERQQALRRGLRAAFDGVLEEPVPDRLTAAARTAPAGASRTDSAALPPAKVTDLGHARAARTSRTENARRRWSLPVWGAMAASLALGAIVAYLALRTPGSAPFSAVDGQLVAQGGLERALTNRLSSQQGTDEPIQVGISFLARSGEYCRSFVLRDGEGIAGLACREGDAWAVEMLARQTSDATGGGYRPADTELPPAMLDWIGERIAGEPLDAAGEAAARNSHWRR